MRRAKSSSSTSSLYHQRTFASIDPFVTRHHAEVAAIEAYSRPREFDNARPAISRRGSQKTGRSEGSHFEDHRLGRRGSGRRSGPAPPSSNLQGGRNRLQKRISQGLQPPPQPVHIQVSSPRETSYAGDGDNVEHKVITKRRSIIPPSLPSLAVISPDIRSDQLHVPSTAHMHPTRIPSTTDDNGSPAPRRTPLPSAGNGSRHDNSGHSQFERLQDFRNEIMPGFETCQLFATPSRQAHAAAERDKILHDFQQQSKLRGRKSFIFAPFQRRRATAGHPSLDTSLPPFNDADQPDMALFSRVDAFTEPDSRIEVQKCGSKPRNFTSTIKGRFSKVFRRTSQCASSLPPQQVEAKSRHYLFQNSPIPGSVIQDEALSSSNELSPHDTKQETNMAGRSDSKNYSPRASSRLSQVQASTSGRSRITSWTNSTIAATASTRLPSGTTLSTAGPADEHGMMKRTNSMATLRKASTTLSRHLSGSIRRQSRQGLRSSEESQGLYSALKQRLMPSQPRMEDKYEDFTADNIEVSDSVEGAVAAQTSALTTRSRRPDSALSSLPSQQKAPHLASLASPWIAQTIRSVTPDNAIGSQNKARELLSPVNEILSPGLASQVAEQINATPRTIDTYQSSLRRRGATKLKSTPQRTSAPSASQIASRIERESARWQSPLDGSEGDFALARTNRNALVVQDSSRDLPHHARIHSDSLASPVIGRKDVLSPSVYSRGTDGASPRPETPALASGTIITVTGREVMRYELSPPKQGSRPPGRKPMNASSEWRRWFSKEMKGLDGHDQEANGPSTGVGFNTASESRDRQRSLSPELATSTRPPPPREDNEQRPRLSSRRSSFMNERYPMIINASKESISTKERRASSYVADRKSSSGVSSNRKSSAAQSRLSLPTSITRPSGDDSDAALRKTSKTIAATTGTGADECHSQHRDDSVIEAYSRLSTATQKQPHLRKPSSIGNFGNKAVSNTGPHVRSAFDLRARYRNSNTAPARTVEIRRGENKAPDEPHNFHQDIMPLEEDNTIRRISHGPYADDFASTVPHGEGNSLPASRNSKAMLKENALPSPSSSEWLAATPGVCGDGNRWDGRLGSRCSPLARDVPGAKTRTSVQVGASCSSSSLVQVRSSPAQRMVTEWLDEKKSREGSSPAFV